MPRARSHILEEECVHRNDGPPPRHDSERRRPVNQGRERDEKINCDPKIVDREDAVDSAQIKSSEITGRISSVQKNAADQESGQDEKEIHPAPADAGSSLQVGHESNLWCG